MKWCVCVWGGGGVEGGIGQKKKKIILTFFFKRGPMLVASGLSGKQPPWPIPASQTDLPFMFSFCRKTFFLDSRRSGYKGKKNKNRDKRRAPNAFSQKIRLELSLCNAQMHILAI